MPYFSILSIVYRFFVSSDVVNYFAFIVGTRYAVAVMAPFIVMEAFVHLMLGCTPGIVRYTQRTAGIDEALAQYPQH